MILDWSSRPKQIKNIYTYNHHTIIYNIGRAALEKQSKSR